MGKLIDSDWLRAQWDEPTDWKDGDQVLHHYIWYKTMIDVAPTVDVAPVKHGRWEWDGEAFVCSACGSGYKGQPTMMGKPLFEFCPVCGAKMDGKDDDYGKAD